MAQAQPPRGEALVLGSGTSFGVPFIGCDCAVCTSTNPRNQRLRCSLLVRLGEATILIDCGPDFRQQALRANLTHIDALILTHEHADHVLGMDDLRAVVTRRRPPVPVHAWPGVLDVVRRIYAYAFEDSGGGSFKPRFDLREVDPGGDTFEVAGVTVQQIPIDHGDCRVLGVRIGDLAYLPDVKAIPDEAAARLQDLDTLLVGAPVVRDHPTHWRLEQALEKIAELAPRQAFLTHLSHNLDAATADEELPEGVRLAYDGLCLAL